MNLLRNLAQIPRLVRYEFARLWSSTMGILATLALFAIPTIYTTLYLWGNYNPQDHAHKYPVAVVNLDEGLTRLDGERVNHGDQVVQNLLAQDVFKFEVTDPKRADELLREDYYGFIVTMPPSFSADLESAATDEPRQASIKLTTNDANNALGTQFGQRLAEAVRAAVSSEVGDQAALKMLDGLATVRDGLGTAIDGGNQLTDGANQLHDGLIRAGDGAAQLDAGTLTLADGAAQASSGANQLADGLAQLNAKTSELPSQAARLADGARQVADGDAQIAAAANRVNDVVQTANAEHNQLRSDVIDLLLARGVDPSIVDEATQLFAPVNERIDEAAGKAQDTTDKINLLAAGAEQVADGAQQLAEASPQLANAVSQLSAGANQLRDGTAQLADGSTQLHAGAQQLAEGIGTARDASALIADGMTQLRDGLVDGQRQIPESTPESRAIQAAVIGSPVGVEEQSIAEAGSYGATLAPFFCALAAWVGVYALFLIVQPYSKRAATALAAPGRVAVAGWLAPTLIGAAQMITAYLSLRYVVGLPFAHGWATVGLLILASGAFASIILALNVWFGSVGQFFALLLMFMQLVGTGGTFPWQTLPEPIRTIHQYLPMTWLTEGLRQSMYGGNMEIYRRYCLWLTLLLWACVSVAALGVARKTNRRTLRDLEPSIIGQS